MKLAEGPQIFRINEQVVQSRRRPAGLFQHETVEKFVSLWFKMADQSV